MKGRNAIVEEAPERKERRQDTSTSQVLGNGLDVLSLIAKTNGELSLREIGRLLGLSPTVTHRLVSTLRQRSFLGKNPLTGKYIIGIESYRVGRGYTDAIGTESVAKPILQEAGQTLGVNCFLGARKDASIVYLYDFSAARRSSIRIAPGTEVPLVSTAMGLAILAAMPHEQREDFRKTIFDRTEEESLPVREFDERVRFAQTHGYAKIVSELFPSVTAVGAYIHQPNSDLEAAISFGLPSYTTSEAELRELGEQVVLTAQRIEDALRGRTVHS